MQYKVGAWALVAPMLILVLAGCEPVMRELQFINPRVGLFPMRMTLGIGAEKIDAWEAMRGVRFVGEVRRGNLIVRYPEGFGGYAEQIANAFSTGAAELKERTGITWAFDPILNIVPVTRESLREGYRIAIPVKSKRVWELPVLICSARHPAVISEWTAGIAHEITEASMLAYLTRRRLILGDYCAFGIALVNQTRWFREGVAEYAGDIVNWQLFGDRYQPPTEIHVQFLQVGDALFSWDNCQQVPDEWQYYQASRGLIFGLIERFGDNVIAKITDKASAMKYINAHSLRRAVRNVIGMDLSEFVRTYEPSWLGLSCADTAPTDDSQIVAEENQVKVVAVYRGFPGEKWKLQPGDIIVSVDGRTPKSSAWFEHYVAAKKPRERVLISILRGGKHHTHNMMVISRPRDMDAGRRRPRVDMSR